MARITVEDCIDKFPSRFELVLVASNRARKLHAGEDPTVNKDNDKNTVIALREIAQETISTNQFQNDLIEEYQTATFTEDEDLEEVSEIESSKENNSLNDNQELKLEEHNQEKEVVSKTDVENEGFINNEDSSMNTKDEIINEDSKDNLHQNDN